MKELPTLLQKGLGFYVFRPLYLKKNIQNKLNYAISVYRIHHLNRQPFCHRTKVRLTKSFGEKKSVGPKINLDWPK